MALQGTDDGYVNSVALPPTLNTPKGIAIHPATGELYWCDSGGHTVRKLTNGRVVTVVGSPGNASFNFQNMQNSCVRVSPNIWFCHA